MGVSMTNVPAPQGANPCEFSVDRPFLLIECHGVGVAEQGIGTCQLLLLSRNL
jgi:hypothetical protein